MINAKEIRQIEATFRTENIPAPYKYQYKLTIDLNPDQIEADDNTVVNYSLQYMDREDMDEDDIIEEGFTMNDDFEWNGKIPLVWIDELKKMLAETSWSMGHKKPPHDESSSLSLKITEASGVIHENIPVNKDSWEYFLQELIQAIYETCQRESPLEVKYKEIDEKKNETLILIKPFFSSRTLEINIKSENQSWEKKNLSWNNLKPLLKSVYFPDYDYDYALEKVPKKSGKYIDNGEGVWYEFGVGVKNPASQTDSLQKLEQSLKELL
ncbi:hypothetical protein BH23BAC1_BH23BAC1_26180 [soil metagenome]